MDESLDLLYIAQREKEKEKELLRVCEIINVYNISKVGKTIEFEQHFSAHIQLKAPVYNCVFCFANTLNKIGGMILNPLEANDYKTILLNTSKVCTKRSWYKIIYDMVHGAFISFSKWVNQQLKVS